MAADQAAVARLLDAWLPEIDRHGPLVEESDGEGVRLRFPLRPEFVGPGRVFSGPTLLGFADTAMFAAVQIRLDAGRVALMSTVSATFVRAAEAADIVVLARAIRVGRTLANAEAWLFGHAVVEPVLHATATYALRDAP